MRSTQWLGVQWKELLWDLQRGAWLSSSRRRTLRSSAIQLGTETVYHPTTAMTDITAGLEVLRGWPLLCSTSNVCRWPGTWFFSRPSLPAKVAAAGIMSLRLYTFEGFCGIPNTDTLLYSGAQTLYVQMHVCMSLTELYFSLIRRQFAFSGIW